MGCLYQCASMVPLGEVTVPHSQILPIELFLSSILDMSIRVKKQPEQHKFTFKKDQFAFYFKKKKKKPRGHELNLHGFFFNEPF